MVGIGVDTGVVHGLAPLSVRNATTPTAAAARFLHHRVFLAVRAQFDSIHRVFVLNNSFHLEAVAEGTCHMIGRFA